MSYTKFFSSVFALCLSLFFSGEKIHGEVIEDCIPYPKHQEEPFLYCLDWDFPLQLYVDHVEGRWLDNHDGYSTLGAFVASPHTEEKNVLLFCDARLHFFNQGKTAGNYGGGLRYIDRDNLRVFGVNAYYDYRVGSWNKYFHQVGLGLEILTPDYDLRFNAYVPTSGWGHSKHVVFDDFIGDFKAVRRQRRSALYGGDLEIGYWFTKRDCCNWFDFYGAVGAYYYARQSCEKAIVGGEVRLATNLGRYFNVEVRGGYDKIYDCNYQGRITFTIPFKMGSHSMSFDWTEEDNIPRYQLIDVYVKRDSFCPATPTPQRDCIYDNYCISEIAYRAVRRQEIMVLSKKECCWTWNWDAPCSDCH